MARDGRSHVFRADVALDHTDGEIAELPADADNQAVIAKFDCAVDLAIEGLTPSGPGQSYVLWLAGSGGRSLPVAFKAVGSDGKLTGRTPIPTAAEGLLPSFTSVVLTLTRQREAAAAVQRAAQSATLPQVVGTPVMRGALR